MGKIEVYKGWDEDQAKRDAEAMKGQGGDFWKPREGRNVVRFLPALSTWDHGPFTFVAEHYVQLPAKKFNFPCPKQLAGKGCPVCERADLLFASQSKPDVDMAYKLFAKKQVYANIIDRKEPEKGAQVYKFGKKVWQFLQSIHDDPDVGGDFTHPEKGFDIIINRQGTGIKTEYTVQPGKVITLGNMEWVETQPGHRKPRLYTRDQILEMLIPAKEGEAAPPARQIATSEVEVVEEEEQQETASDYVQWG